MALFGVPIVIPSVFGILWRKPNTKGVYLCIVSGVVSGILLKTCWKELSWEAGTFVQIGVCFAGFFGGALLGTSKRERESKDELFATLDSGRKEENEKLCNCGNMETAITQCGIVSTTAMDNSTIPQSHNSTIP